MKIATLNYSTFNIGDDIQALALEQMLPRVDLRVDRDYLAAAQEWSADVRWILSGWFASGAHRSWPPPGKARRLYIGFHAVDPGVLPRDATLPIGCRDPWTLTLCCRLGIEAWLSYCVTLTLLRPSVPRDDRVLLVDVSDQDLGELPPEIARGARVTHNVPRNCDRRAEAARRLDLYARARWVVTSRLHALLPCAAFGTPVVFFRPRNSESRYTGYTHLGWRASEAPWHAPRPKADAELIYHMAQPLRSAVQRFLHS